METRAGSHTLLSDLPAVVGGKDRGPTGTELLAMAMAACATAALTFYGERAGLDVREVAVDVSYERASDPVRLTNLRVAISAPHVSDPAQREQLLSMARRCPVHQTMVCGEPIEFVLTGF